MQLRQSTTWCANFSPACRSEFSGDSEMSQLIIPNTISRVKLAIRGDAAAGQGIS